MTAQKGKFVNLQKADERLFERVETVIPKGWEKTYLGRHIELLTGYPFKSNEYFESPNAIRLLRGDNIHQGFFRWDSAKLWDKEKTQGLAKYELVQGDVILAMDRTWVSSGLKCAVIKNTDTPCLLVQRVARLRGRDFLLSEYLGQLIRTYNFETYVKGVQTETVVPHISAKQIREFPIQLPPLPEQKEIAEILGKWDEGIEKVEKLIDSKKRLKKGLMQQLLTGKERFNEFKGQEWKEVKPGDLGET